MSANTEPTPPRDSMYIEWGKFKAGASGRIAVAGFIIIAILALVAYCYFGLNGSTPKLP